MTLNDATVLVTGSRGFIGTAVCASLRDRGATVHGVGRSASDEESDGIHYHASDLTDAESTAAIVSLVRPDYIVHLAGCSVAKRELEWVPKTFSANLVTTVNILCAAQSSGVGKTIIAGSLEQPDDVSTGADISSPYAASKWAATAYSRMFHSVYSLAVATARIFMVYGPGQKELQKMIPYVCLSAMSGRSPELMSGGRLVDWVYVDDVANGIISLLRSGPIDGSLVDIGTGRLVSTGEIAEQICELAGTGVHPEFGAVPDRAMEQVRKADVERTARETGWRPQVTIEDGLQRTLSWYRRMHGSQ